MEEENSGNPGAARFPGFFAREGIMEWKVKGMLSEYKLQGMEENIPVRIIRSGRKSIGLEVTGDGTALARIPARLSDRELGEFLKKHEEWLQDKVRMVRERQNAGESTNAVPVNELTAEDIEYIKKRISERVEYYSSFMGVSYGRVTIRNQKTRWGSCSAKGNLNFNYQLAYLPQELLDYVVVHELSHRRHMNHSAEFWQEVEKYYPAYEVCRKRLKEIRMVEG